MELQHTNSDSPLKTPKIKPDNPLSKRIDTVIEDKELVDDVFIDANDNQLGEEKQSILCGAKRRKSIKEIQDEKYKKCNDFWNIGTIFLSSLLTFIESTKLIFITDDTDIFVKNIFDLTPIFFGTVITCSASIIKFKKYQEKMELLNIIIDKCIIMITKLKNKREEIKLLSDCGEEFHKLKNDYVNNICKEFSDVYQESERYITNNDYDIYLRIINNSDYNKHIIDTDKTLFYKNYYHEIDIEKIVSNLDLKKENCCI